MGCSRSSPFFLFPPYYSTKKRFFFAINYKNSCKTKIIVIYLH